MKVLVVGSGGREHALCWRLRQSPLLTELYCAPGNPGIAEIADCVPLAADEIHRLADFAQDLAIDLTIVGPELPLTLGLVNEFSNRELRIFGPTQKAAIIEGSKVFAKQFMNRHQIPTADFEIVHQRSEAERAAKKFGFPVVLKADGLAAGKGVLIVENKAELSKGLDAFFEERRFGSAGDRILVEEFLTGEEASFIVISDGQHALPLASSKDYKRIGEGDIGPNTGGMGAHSPAGILNREMAREVLERVIRPTITGMAEEGRAFRGFLYAGLILTDQGLKVLEFNGRLGDPEAQVLMMRLEDDLLPVLKSGADGQFSSSRLHFSREAAACVVLASEGYPIKATKGHVIEGIAEANALPGVEVFHAGTKNVEGEIVVSGGRVLNLCATGSSLRDAFRSAYQGVAKIQWPSKVFRRDIGRRIIENL